MYLYTLKLTLMIEHIFGNLKVVKQINSRYCECVCLCGTIVKVRKDHLTNGDKTNCGCVKKLNRNNRWIGKRFNKLIILKLLDNRKAVCICDCGNETTVLLNNLQKNNTTSCGCTFRSTAGIRHGLLKNYKSEYNSWAMMKNRCLNPKSWSIMYYKNISIYEGWVSSFKTFFDDMGEKPIPKKEYSIDRIDNLKGYYPDNCKWSTKKEQSNNRRKRNSVLS